MTLTKGAIIALLAALAVVAGAAAVSPALAEPVPRESDIQFESDSAKADRAFAASRLDQARERRALAEQARKNARDARNAADRNDWNRKAREYDRLAADLEEEAAGLIAEAERKEAKAGRLQERLNAATQAEHRRRAAAEAEERQIREAEEREAEERRRAAAKKMSRDEVLGVWRDSGDQAPFVIVQEEPGSPIHGYRLELHTLNRVWKGTYTPFEEGDIRREQDARVVFKVKPEAEEINPEVPLWARSAVAGELEWKIELEESGTCSALGLRGRWFPGEITWREGDAGGESGNGGAGGEGGAKKAWISGEGEPIEFELAPAKELHFDITSKPKIQFRIPGQDDPNGTDIESVVKGQTFFVEAIVPKEMAEKLGALAEVKIRGLTGGNTYPLKVKSQPSGDRPVVLYTHIREIAIGDPMDIAAQGKYDANPLSFNPGSVLDFDVTNGEVVEFALGDARRSLRVFDNPTLEGIVRQQEGLALLRVTTAAAVSDDSVSKPERRLAQKRLLMIRNAQALVGLDEKLTPPQRLAIGEAYMGESGTGGMLNAELGPSFAYIVDRGQIETELNTRQFAWYDAQTPDWERRYEHSDHVIWTSHYESSSVKKAVKDAKPDKGKLLADTLLVLSKAMYQITATLSCADGVWIALTKTDIYGKPVDEMDRAAGVAGSLLCFGPGMLRLLGEARASAAGMRGVRGFRLGKSLPPQRVVVKESSGPMPSSLSPEKLEAMGLGPRPGAAGSPGFGPVSCARPTISPPLPRPTPPPGPPRPLPPQALPPLPRPTLTPGPPRPVHAVPGSTAHLGPNARIEYGFGDLSKHRQVMPQSCQVQSQNFLREQAGMGFRSEAQSMKDLRDFGVYVPYSRTQKQGWSGGLDDLQTRDAALLSGGTASKPKSLSLEQMAAARANGWEVKNVLHVNKGTPNEALHAVGIVHLERGAKNQITRVHFFDPAVGYVVSLPACEYKQLLSTTGGPKSWPNSQGFRWGRPAGGRTAARPTVEPPGSAPSGTRPPGAASGVPGPKPPHNQIPGQNRTIDEALDDFYGGKDYDPLHVTSFEAYKEIRQSRQLDYPAKGGASFSIGGKVGGVRQGNTAIRIKPEYAKNHIEWVTTPQGLVARHYLKGKDANGNWIGDPVTYIPTENLEIFEPGTGPGQGGWFNIPQPPTKN